MKLEVAIDSKMICSMMEEERLEELNMVLNYLDCFEHCHYIFTKDIEEVYDKLYNKENRHEDEYIVLSRWLDKVEDKGNERLCFDDNQYTNLLCIIEDKLSREENGNFKEILQKNKGFDFSQYKAVLYSENKNAKLRNIDSIDSGKKLISLFANSIHDIKEFITILKDIYPELIFDEDIEKSMEDLQAGFIERRKEILYHLYCIDKEIPLLAKKYSGNQEIGKNMSVDCSPERHRDVVDKYLTKDINGKSLKCELHTKMQKFGGQKPDRIYFCAQVPENVDKDMAGRCYIYKITKHVLNM